MSFIEDYSNMECPFDMDQCDKILSSYFFHCFCSDAKVFSDWFNGEWIKKYCDKCDKKIQCLGEPITLSELTEIFNSYYGALVVYDEAMVDKRLN